MADHSSPILSCTDPSTGDEILIIRLPLPLDCTGFFNPDHDKTDFMEYFGIQLASTQSKTDQNLVCYVASLDKNAGDTKLSGLAIGDELIQVRHAFFTDFFNMVFYSVLDSKCNLNDRG